MGSKWVIEREITYMYLSLLNSCEVGYERKEDEGVTW